MAKNGEYVIVRTYGGDVFAGVLESENRKEAILTDARHLWYWEGAASLSEMAMKGTDFPGQCQFLAPVDRITLPEPKGIFQTTPEAESSIRAVPAWTSQ